MTAFPLLSFFFLKTVQALICGGVIGFERERKQKTAGVKTNTLICLGAMLYTSIASFLPHDGPRVIAQIVTGIGFLGAGAILHPTADRVAGLTTAALIWTVAALGILIGLGYGWTAVIFALFIAATITAISWLERRFYRPKGPPPQ